VASRGRGDHGWWPWLSELFLIIYQPCLPFSAWRSWPPSPPRAAGPLAMTRNDYITWKYEEIHLLPSAHRENVHPIPQSFAGTTRYHPERPVVVRCTTEVHLPPNRPGCNAHPRHPLRRRGGPHQCRRAGVIGSTSGSSPPVPPAPSTGSDGYRSNIGKRPREDVAVSFEPRLTLKARDFSWRTLKEYNQSCIHCPGVIRCGRGISLPTSDREYTSSDYFHRHTSSVYQRF